MGHRKQVLHLAKVGAAMFFLPHPYIVAPTSATDMTTVIIKMIEVENKQSS